MATFTSILAWETPWTGGPGRLQSMGSQELDTTEQLNNNRSMDDHEDSARSSHHKPRREASGETRSADPFVLGIHLPGW